MYELFGEAMLFLQTIGKSRKLGPAQSPKVSVMEEPFATEGVLTDVAVALITLVLLLWGRRGKLSALLLSLL
jgi:hypothetical protein